MKDMLDVTIPINRKLMDDIIRYISDNHELINAGVLCGDGSTLMGLGKDILGKLDYLYHVETDILKPCPLCGSYAQYSENFTSANIFCGCGLTMIVYNPVDTTKRDMYKKWNSRRSC